jgi:flagellin-like protein
MRDLKIDRNRSKRRGVAGIIAAVIMFAMIFTAGLSFLLYQVAVSGQYDKANVAYQLAAQARIGESNSVIGYPNLAKSTLNVSAVVTNLGSNYVNLTAFYIEDQTGKVACFSPHQPGLAACRVYYGHTTNKMTLPGVILNTGSGVNITSDISSTNGNLTSCSFTTPCTVGVVTQRGNLFSGVLPGPITTSNVLITTTLSSLVINPGQTVYDTAKLSGVTGNAGGTVTYSWYNSGTCSGAAIGSQSGLPVTSGAVPSSSSVKFANSGSYSWNAVYSGDPKNSGATSPCEPLSVFSPQSCIPTSSNFCFATVASGLGSLAFDFDSFKWYSSGACSPQGPTPLAVIGQSAKSSCSLKDGLAGAFGANGVKNAPRAYTISQTGMTNAGSNLWFSINVTNADPLNRTIVLDQYSQLWFSWFCPQVLGANGPCQPGPHGQISTTYYGLVQVSGGTSVVSTPTLTLNFKQTATIFFGLQDSDAGQLPGIPLCGYSGSVPYSSQVTPVFLFFHGTINGLQWGQDFPLAATLWTDIGSSC